MSPAGAADPSSSCTASRPAATQDENGSLNPSPTVASTRTSGASCVCGCLTRPRRYPSDLTDAQWAVLEPLLPAPSWQRSTGRRPEQHSRRQIINALFYLVDNGIKWRAMPADFPPWRTVYGYFIRWSDNLTTVGLTHRLRASLRAALGRRAQPSAGCIRRPVSPRVSRRRRTARHQRLRQPQARQRS
ncbi:hypothetical protein CSH63_05280 [Micromonospora tulbaghiae]|uniref:Insertion element IS402-like domain-containing protein n=1 Tax=Micromonospora tulbaghiae TaxID=479978 RepID=A0A386WGP7_9ACTN|nr:hypothetical protein CSH63_05280 [Micromonospora tulbaghiae]